MVTRFFPLSSQRAAKQAFAILLPLIFVLGPTAYADEQKAKKPPVQVIAYQAETQQISQNLKLIGLLKAKQSVEIRAIVTERIHSLPFQEGQRVQEGDIIAELVKQEEEAELKQATILADEAKRQYLRTKRLKGRGNITEATIDEKKSIWLSAEADKDIIQARLNDRVIRAPFSGYIGYKQVEQGALVSTTTLITTLDNTQQMYLDLLLPDSYIEQVKIGQSVSISIGENQNFQGKIIVINPRMDEQSRLLQVRALIDNKDGFLKSGMSVQANLHFEDQQQLIVPETAILMQGEKSFVYVITQTDEETSSVKKTPVTVGKRYFGQVQIMKGIQAGDIIVSQGTLRIRPKNRIKIKAYQQGQPQEALLHGKVLKTPETKVQAN